MMHLMFNGNSLIFFNLNLFYFILQILNADWSKLSSQGSLLILSMSSQSSSKTCRLLFLQWKIWMYVQQFYGFVKSIFSSRFTNIISITNRKCKLGFFCQKKNQSTVECKMNFYFKNNNWFPTAWFSWTKMLVESVTSTYFTI